MMNKHFAKKSLLALAALALAGLAQAATYNFSGSFDAQSGAPALSGPRRHPPADPENKLARIGKMRAGKLVPKPGLEPPCG